MNFFEVKKIFFARFSSNFRVSQNCLSYAGTKDRRGVTTQRMCAKRLTAKRLSSLRFPRLWLGNFEYKERQLNLGDLKGNRFLMALRFVFFLFQFIEIIATFNLLLYLPADK